MLFGFPWVGLGEFAYDISWALLLGQIADGNCCFAPCSQAVSMQAWSSGSLWLGLWSFWLARFGMFSA